MKLLFCVAPTVFFAVYGQFITKWRVGTLSQSLVENQGIIPRLLIYLSDPLILSAYFSSFFASIAWVFVIERYEVSIAFPVYIGLITIFVSLGGVLVFDETLNLQKTIATVLIVAGVIVAVRA